MKKIWLTAQELASLLQVSLKTVRRAYRSGEIPMVRLRHMVRFDVEDVKRVMLQKVVRPSRRVVASRKQGAIGGAAAGAHRRIAPVR